MSYLTQVRRGLIGKADPLAPLRASALAYWPCNEGSGSVLHDATGHGYDLTCNTAPTWVGGHIGASAPFLNSNPATRATAPNPTVWTLAQWVNVQTALGNAVFLGASNGTTAVYWMGGGKNADFQFTQYGPLTTADTIALPTNQWLFLVGQFTGTALQQYRNTAFISQTAVSGSVLTPTSLGLGGQSTYPADIYTEQAGIWPAVLTLSQIALLWNNGAGVALFS